MSKLLKKLFEYNVIQGGGTYDTYALRRHSKANRLEIQKAEDANYGSVNSYHKDAWLVVYNINLSSIRGGAA